MGIYLNPGNEEFRMNREHKYVDKSGLIVFMNDRVNTSEQLVSFSRPRRFGKSYAAQMLCAYYDAGCDSSSLFDDLIIADAPTYRTFLNQFNVIYLDLAVFLSDVGSPENIPAFIKKQVTKEILQEFPNVKEDEVFAGTLIHAVKESGRKFVAIIDEWDVLIRDKDVSQAAQKEYLEFLRALFKNSGTTNQIFAAAYMTGILPIKKDGTHTALSNFDEYSMLEPQELAEYVGFTEAEVRELCEEAEGRATQDFDRNADAGKQNQNDPVQTGTLYAQMKQWYDGYVLDGAGSVYNPNSVMKALKHHKFKSYWQKTASSEALLDYIGLDYAGLSKTIAELIGGGSVKINADRFQNDIVSFRSQDDVLTLLVHFGYLTYNEEEETVNIPNEEILREFTDAVKEVELPETVRRVKDSRQLLEDIVMLKEEKVAEHIERIHDEETNPLYYNREEDLKSTIRLAMFCYRDYYIRFEELPAGKGYADMVYLPKKRSNYPALVMELKWNEDSQGAISQIKDRNYPASIKDYGGEILLVGISYDKEASGTSKKHNCRIEKFVK
ncbi:MAG: AAA family ATPase [Clostridia bacterium]|nr:AAA family ATPase [Clostridia bacterium]